MNKKIKFIIWLVIVIILAVIAFFVWKPVDTNVKEPVVKTEEKVKSVIPDGVKIKNEKITVDGINIAHTMDVVNEGKKELNLDRVNISFYDAKNNKITGVTNIIGVKLAADEGINITTQTTMEAGQKIAKTIYKFKEKK